MATTTRKDPYFRPAAEGGDRGRGAVSPLGGRSNPDRSFRSNGAGKIISQPLKKARGTQQPVINYGRGKPIATAR
jgi:hypothetical protein